MSEFATIRVSSFGYDCYLVIDKIVSVTADAIDPDVCHVYLGYVGTDGSDAVPVRESAEHFLLRCREILDDLEETKRSEDKEIIQALRDHAAWMARAAG